MEPAKQTKESQAILEILKNKSRKGLEFAARKMLEKDTTDGALREALHYYVSGWEDPTHPGLLSLACEATGRDSGMKVEFQGAIAMIAAALDIHDDIIDRSKTKHGTLTVFGKYGHDTSLILGDVFFVSGLTLLGEASATLPERKARDILSTCRKSLLELGTAHILESDLKRKMDAAPEEYMRILEMKAASIEADMRIGAMAAGGRNVDIEALTKYGRIIGILGILREEFIDLFEVGELSHRIREECLPIPLLYLLQDKESKARLQGLITKQRLRQDDVNDLVDVVLEAESVKRLRKKMNALVQESTSLLSTLRDSEAKVTLRNLSTSMLEDL